MPFIDYDPSKYQEPKPVANGRYDLTIAQCDTVQSKAGNDMYKVRMEIDGHDEAPPVFENLSLPYPGCAQIIGLNFNRFMALFKVPLEGGFDTDVVAVELVGKRANAELKQEEYNGNTSNKIQLPKLSSEPANTGKGSPPSSKKKTG